MITAVTLLVSACGVASHKAGSPEARTQAAQHVVNARAYVAQNRRDLAIRELDQAIALDATQADYYARRGHLKGEAGGLADGLPDIDKALQLNPGHGYANFDRALLRYVSGDLPGAVQDADLALRVEPDSPRFLGVRCIAGVANGEGDGGLLYCQQALRQPQGRESAYAALGQAYLELGRNPEAQQAFEASLQANPRLMRALYGRGLARLRQGDAAAGRADMEAATARLPGAGREFRPLP